jgi:hypothetical protein
VRLAWHPVQLPSRCKGGFTFQPVSACLAPESGISGPSILSRWKHSRTSANESRLTYRPRHRESKMNNRFPPVPWENTSPAPHPSSGSEAPAGSCGSLAGFHSSPRCHRKAMWVGSGLLICEAIAGALSVTTVAITFRTS